VSVEVGDGDITFADAAETRRQTNLSRANATRNR
jgi:hypothetical protein